MYAIRSYYEIGSEWMCYQALEQLRFDKFLEKQGWSNKDINLAKTHLISRAVYPVITSYSIHYTKLYDLKEIFGKK